MEGVGKMYKAHKLIITLHILFHNGLNNKAYNIPC